MNKNLTAAASNALDLETVVLAKIVPDKAIPLTRRSVRLSSFERGANIKNQLQGNIGYLVSGAVSKGAKLSMATTYVPGCWIGLSQCVKSPIEYDEDLQCISDVDVIRIPISAILSLPVDYSNDVAQKIGRLMMAEHEKANFRLFCKCVLTAERQITAYFASIVRFHSLLEFNNIVELPLSQKILSEMTGVARTNVSSAVLQLSDAGLLRNAYRVIQLCELQSWVSMANAVVRGDMGNLDAKIKVSPRIENESLGTPAVWGVSAY